MNKIKLLLTFDYELPLGNFSSYDQGLFKPGQALIEAGERMEVPIVLFADICSALRFKEVDYDGYYLRFQDQLQDAIKRGHDVQLHIHPHWMTTELSKNHYKPSLDFSLGHFNNSSSKYSINEIIEKSIDELVEICTQVDPSYKCVAYRAGGYGITSSYSDIVSSLIKNNIKIDSSVIKDFYLKKSFSELNFSNMPNKSRWQISPENGINFDSESGLYELPITGIPINIMTIAKRRFNKIVNRKKLAQFKYDHGGAGYPSTKIDLSIYDKYRHFINPSRLMFDAEHSTVDFLEKIVRFNVKAYEHEKRDIILTGIGHPKSMGDHHIQKLERFIDRMRSTYKDRIEFVSYQKVLSSLS